MGRSLVWAVALLASGTSALAQSFVNFDAPQTRPIRLSADGTRLYALNTPDNRLAVFSLASPSNPVLLKEIPVGLEPVSIAPRTADEVWVVNWLSDSVSVVSVSQGVVLDTIYVKDEPADVVFAGNPQRAFVSVSGSKEVRVFDPSSLALLATVPIFGDDPRALASSADGSKVWVAVHRSGNQTTIVPVSLAPPQPPPTNPALPAPPQVGLIVSSTDPTWQAVIGVNMPDNDVVEIDANSFALLANYHGVGTTLFSLAVRPGPESLWIANTEARNLVRFVPNLRGHSIDSRVTRIEPGNPPAVAAFDLNPGVDYATLPNPSALASALSQPTDLVFDPSGQTLYVASFGTDRIGVLDPTGAVLDRIEVGSTPGTAVDPGNKRGPRGLAHHPTASRLYVLNRLSNTLSVVDTVARTVVRELPVVFDPTPPVVKRGRGFLYDAKLSGNGTEACASCHVDGDLDGLAWDLGEPGGSMQTVVDPFGSAFSMHPMKGPLTTQTVRGLAGLAPYHWRGDRQNLEAFNGGFGGILAGSPLSPSDLADWVAFQDSVTFAPNPNQNLDRTYPTTPPGVSAYDGFVLFTGTPFINGLLCVECHALPSGTNTAIMQVPSELGFQSFKVARLQNIYRKLGRVPSPSGVTAGFGVTHDGQFQTVFDFLSQPATSVLANQTVNKTRLERFVLALDTGTAPAVGYSRSVSPATAASSAVAADFDLLSGQASAGNCALVAKGVFAGQPHGFQYVSATGQFLSDKAGLGPFAWDDLKSEVLAGNARLTLMGVPPGSGARIGIDRDEDGVLDGDEGLEPYGASTPGCAGPIAFTGNSSPEVGNSLYAYVCSGAPPGASGFVLIGLAQASIPILGITLLVDPSFGLGFNLPSDATGTGVAASPIPNDPTLVGGSFYLQAFYLSPCAPQGLAASQGLEVTVQP